MMALHLEILLGGRMENMRLYMDLRQTHTALKNVGDFMRITAYMM